ncbi:MAG TPA: hypothetical protein VK427_08525 [Kofleriaceae bacterium]|nr:hypothetical protein [Kofleriaceae bacterium]
MSCFVDRRSDELACDMDADCDGDSECDDGVCVPLSCPNVCDSCADGKRCVISCNGPNECRNGVVCPSGYSCAIACTQDCGPIRCELGCTVSCQVNADCGPISCGADATCTCTAAPGGFCR